MELLFFCDNHFNAMSSFLCPAFLVSILGVSSKFQETVALVSILRVVRKLHAPLSDITHDLFVLEQTLDLTCDCF